MLRNLAHLAVAGMSAIALMVMTQPAYGHSSHVTVLKPPTLNPFFHLQLGVTNSTFVTATNDILTGQANNQGGTPYLISHISYLSRPSQMHHITALTEIKAPSPAA